MPDIEGQQFVTDFREAGIEEVMIDTDRGMDRVDVPSAEDVGQDIVEAGHAEALGIPEPADQPEASTVRESIGIREEIDNARQIRTEARDAVASIMDEARFGRPVEVEKVDRTVSSMMDSILRNSNALISLNRIKTKDDYTFMHSVSVCALMISFCQAMKIDVDTARQIAVGAMLHDVGKAKTPQEILTKAGKLSAEEFTIMREHVVDTKKLLSETPGIAPLSVTLAAEHHERFDGSGYPAGLRDGDISPFGQMVAIADVYDAMTSNRTYQKGMEPAEVVRRIYGWSGSHFEKTMVQGFIKSVGIYPVGTLVRLENGLLGFVLDFTTENLLHPLLRVVYDLRKNWRVSPYDLDLSDRYQDDRQYRIITHESPEQWNLNPQNFLQLA